MSLVLVFLFSAGLLFCLEVEFLALSFIIVYVGAIAILFLFVVMMLDIKIGDNSLSFLAYGPVGYFLVFLFLLEITIPLINLVGSFDSVFSSDVNYFYVNWLQEIDYITNINAIGQLLYTYYFVYFLMSGLILYIAMIGALMLTLTLNRVVKKQIVYKQLARQGDNSFLKVK
jgi:NADH-quinone oxidoreductase subunit J|tara:strand:+ start:353 stop:868 length:516 start_codon:yes stop_codon:yes gene_type:complete